MSDMIMRRLAEEIEDSGMGEMTSLELQELMYNADIGMSPVTLEKYMKEALFSKLLRPIAWKKGRGSQELDHTRVSNVARWKRGPRFDEILDNGGKVQEVVGDVGEPRTDAS